MMDPTDFARAALDAASDPAQGPEELAAPTTESVIASMLTENTGRHMLDSGGAYGRAWQRNQGRDFANEPEAYIDGIALEDRGDCWPMLSLYHFLTVRVDYDEEMDNSFHAFAMSDDWEREPWNECLEAWAESQGLVINVAGNTYNEETFLDQDFAFQSLVSPEDKDAERDLFDADTLFAIASHNGADIRGGYSAPRIFRTSLILLMDATTATIECAGCEREQVEQLPGLEDDGPPQHVWDIDRGDVFESVVSGSHWLGETLLDRDTEPFASVRSLPEYWTVPTDPQGIIYRSDHAWHCPRCGAELTAHAPYPSEG